MEAIILTGFKGMINGIVIESEQIYNTVEYLLDNFEVRFGEIYTQSFVEDMASVIHDVYYNYDSTDMGDIERDFVRCMESSNRFSNIEFKVNNSTWKLDWFNENISMGRYLVSKEMDIDVEGEKRKLEEQGE